MKKILAIGLAAITLASLSQAQYPLNKVSLYSRISLTTFQAGAGNDCWGYVSPSGREYAIMGLDNKVAFVEITDPRSPVVVETIPHSSSSWGDIKVYQDVCYAVSETYTGIQVIDLANIDNGVVTLIRTINSPQRNHNIALNTQSGYLYTCGSRNGTGTTTCFNLANPRDPQQVGLASLTTDYMHDAQIVTYESGPYAGREILFGNSEGRGLDIYDVTNKNGPFLIKRIPYPNVSYGHQCWLSGDRKYVYLDDELDESNYGINSRTRVFNVESLENATYVGFFDSGATSIDHNQYWKDGFLFQANYRSGLRIADTNDNPLAPTQAGYFDTYPANNNASFNGAWSTFPFFPSNTVIVSDIERGLFILNVQEATTRIFSPKTYQITSGTALSGNLASLTSSDNNYLRFLNDDVTLAATVEFDGVSAIKRLSSLKMSLESAADRFGLSQIVQARRFSDNSWQTIDSRVAPTADLNLDITLTVSPSDYVATDGTVRFRISWQPINDEDPAQDGWGHRVDKAGWTAVPYAR